VDGYYPADGLKSLRIFEWLVRKLRLAPAIRPLYNDVDVNGARKASAVMLETLLPNLSLQRRKVPKIQKLEAA
jgi:hypothetical protein